MKISNISTEPLLHQDFQVHVDSFLEARSKEQQAGVPSYWTRCEPSFTFYVILDCTIQHFLKKEHNSTWKNHLHLTSLLRNRRRACLETYGESSKEYAAKYADHVISALTRRDLLADMVPLLDFILLKPLDADFEADFYAYLDRLVASLRQDEKVKRPREKGFVVSVIHDHYATFLMDQMGLAGVTRLLAQRIVRQERAKWRKEHGKGTKRYAEHYYGLITENMARLGALHYSESEPTGNKSVEK